HKVFKWWPYAGYAAAVLLAVLAVSLLLDKWAVDRTKDIVSYARQFKVESADRSATQLILSEDHTVLFEAEESEIDYDSLRIVASQDDGELVQAPIPQQLVVPKGKRAILILPDGSKLWANAG